MKTDAECMLPDQEMRTDLNLHPALYPAPEDGSAATLGHYKVHIMSALHPEHGLLASSQ